MRTWREFRDGYRRSALKAFWQSLAFPISFMLIGKSSGDFNVCAACAACAAFAAFAYLAFTSMAVLNWNSANGVVRRCRENGWDLGS